MKILILSFALFILGGHCEAWAVFDNLETFDCYGATVKIDSSTTRFYLGQGFAEEDTIMHSISFDELLEVGDLDLIWPIFFETKIDRHSDVIYRVEILEGPSTIVEFWIYEKINGKWKDIGSPEVTSIAIAGNGFLYGYRNFEGYNKMRKYECLEGRLREVEQPFYAVGRTTELLKPITIFSDMEQTNEVAKLPVGYQVQILVEKDDQYLIQTEFGLVGWYFYDSLPGCYDYMSQTFKGMCNSGP